MVRLAWACGILLGCVGAARDNVEGWHGGDSAHPSQEQSQQLQARFGFGLACPPGRKTEEKGSAAVGTVSGLTSRDQGREYCVGGGGGLVGGWWAVAQWAARAGPPATIRRLAGGPSGGGIAPGATAKMVRSAGGLRYEAAKPNDIQPDGQLLRIGWEGNGRERRKKGQNRPTVV